MIASGSTIGHLGCMDDKANRRGIHATNIGQLRRCRLSTKAVIGGLLACILLGVYVYLAWVAMSVVDCKPEPACLTVGFTDRMASALALLSGLVSALVISELALTKPGEAPLARSLASDASAAMSNTTKILTFVYLGVWALTGLAALLVSLRHSELQALTDLGQSWLGLAVAAGYAYFGISPQGG
jgi:hypothetical protein